MRELSYRGVSIVCWMGDAVVPNAILVVSVAIPLHAMFICTLVGRVHLLRGGCWGSRTGCGIGSVLLGGLGRGFFGGSSVSAVGWLGLSCDKYVSLVS